MVLFSHSSYASNLGAGQPREEKMNIIKKHLYINDDGEIKEGGKDELPKGWAKGKLLANAGDEVSDLTAELWGIKKPATKAKKPTENKSK